ncbi:MAG: anaerobic ribonucleoside-triphosphate reductase activating protein [Candidatus Pacebacteria bacterium]|nr:anaerobic ribonucleoside-triphosphate reductase activating protein [Candidatus Paceibacterota bacterium]
MVIGGFQKFTLIDYPGKLSCIVFLSGCNFRCPFCYSSELVLPEKIKQQPELSEEKILEYLEKRVGMLEGVVLCGGEPTLNSELDDFCLKLKTMGYFIKLDSNGTNSKKIKELIEKKLIDYIAMDIKAPLTEEKYKIATGVDNNIEEIKKSIQIIKNSGIDYEFRTTVVPGIHNMEDIISIANSIGPAKKYFLQQFNPEKDVIDNSLKKLKPLPYNFFEEVISIINPLFEICRIR